MATEQTITIPGLGTLNLKATGLEAPVLDENDTILRNLGYAKEELQEKTLSDAIGNIPAWLTARLAKIKENNLLIVAYFKKRRDEFIEQKYTDEEAKKKALEYTNVYKKRLDEEFEKKYPTELFNKISRKVTKAKRVL